MELILIRHGESEGNSKKLVYGYTDYPMTKKGMKQVPEIVERLKRYQIDKIYTSPLVRAKVIAEAISQDRDISITSEDRLKEINFGDYEDWPREKLIDLVGQERYGEIVGFFNHVALPGGEKQDEFLLRVKTFIDELLSGQEGSYVLTCHFGTIKAILHHLMAYDQSRLNQLTILPGAIIKVTIEENQVRMDELIQTYKSEE